MASGLRFTKNRNFSEDIQEKLNLLIGDGGDGNENENGQEAGTEGESNQNGFDQTQESDIPIYITQ